MQLLAPLTVVDLYGTPTLLMHGDSLCTLDIGYQKFRAWWDQKWWQKLILSLPLWYRQHLARKARRVSAMDKKGKTSDIMDVTPDEVPKVMSSTSGAAFNSWPYPQACSASIGTCRWQHSTTLCVR